jgi:beta-glucanase (GH16 family)
LLKRLFSRLRGRNAIYAVVLTAIASAKSLSPDLVPPSPAVGYKLVFSDDFDKLDLSPDGTGSNTWHEGVWFHHSHAPRYNISVAGSQLSLVWRAGQGSNDTSIETLSHDKQHAKAWRYGYFEVRAKWDVVKGAWPAFWLLPIQDARGESFYNGVKEVGELDIFEGQGAEPHTFFGTLHDWVDKRNVPSAKNNFPLRDDQDLSQFHTYALLWVPGKVTWFLDDQPLHSENTAAVFDRQDYFLILGIQEGVNWHFGDMAGLSSEKLTLTVDWVRVWQKK